MLSNSIKPKVLFVCTKNQLRSLTAEQIFKNRPEYSVRSAGTASDARRRVNGADIDWADVIFVMEKKHEEIIKYKFPTQTLNKQMICLNIPDQYKYMDEELVRIIEESVNSHFAEK